MPGSRVMAARLLVTAALHALMFLVTMNCSSTWLSSYKIYVLPKSIFPIIIALKIEASAVNFHIHYNKYLLKF